MIAIHAIFALWMGTSGPPGLSAAEAENEVKDPRRLILELRDADASVRQWAALGLAKPEAATEAGIEALLGALRDGARAVRSAARYALSSSGPQAAAALEAYDASRLKRLSAILKEPSFEDLQSSIVMLKHSTCGWHRGSFRHRPCPEFTVRAHGDGAVLYDGGRGVKTHGRHAASIPLDEIRNLLLEFGASGFLFMPEEYSANAKEESHLEGDILFHERGFITTTLIIDGETKEVTRYEGDPGAPKALLDLERSIEKTLGTARWTE